MPAGKGKAGLQALPDPLLCRGTAQTDAGDHGLFRQETDHAGKAGLYLALLFPKTLTVNKP
jgi:hypothetical protein